MRSIAAQMTSEGYNGVGPSNQLFYNDKVAKALQYSHGANAARAYFYNSINAAQLGQGAIAENAVSLGLIAQDSNGNLAYTQASFGGNSSGAQSYMPVFHIPKILLGQ